MMTNEVKNSEKFPYIRDYEIYALWKYVNGYLTGRNVFQFIDLFAPNTNELSILQFLLGHFELWGVELENPVFHKDIYNKYVNYLNYNTLKKYLEKNLEIDGGDALQKILYGKFNIKELNKHILNLNRFGLIEFIEFDKELSKTNRDKINSFLNFYIDEFIKDNLDKIDFNFLSFENQKRTTINLLKKNQNKYGNNFIIKYEPPNEISLDEKKPYLFLHSIVALEKLGLIKCLEAWFIDDVHPEKQTEDYKIKLEIKDKFFEEIEKEVNANTELSINKKIDLKSIEIKYNDDKAILEIGNKKCQIPPYKNEHYFCRAIYEHGVNEPIDWSAVYEKMTGYYEAYYGKPQNTRESWRLVYDTMKAINKRIKNTINTDSDLFTWQEKTVKRNY